MCARYKYVIIIIILYYYTLKNHLQITLNKDDDIAASQIPVMWQFISLTIPFAKQVHLCKICAC